MTIDTIEQAASQLLQAGIANSRTLKGCTEESITKIESIYNIHLPRPYRFFLLHMGLSAGKFLQGSDFLYKDLTDLRKRAEILLKQCKAKFALAPTDFVFLVHQGYQFLFFKTNESEDPPVFLYIEDDELPKQVSCSFSEWLTMCVTDEIAAYRNLQGPESNP